MYQDSQFAALLPGRGQPAASPGRLALTVVLQFMEGLSDREAADAVRGRIDWKYALGLALTDPGFNHTVLSEFRTRLVVGSDEPLLLDTLLQRLQEQGLVRARGRQCTDSTHVLAAVRTLNRLERVGETLRAVLNELAAVAQDWLQAMAPAAWHERYGRRVENYRLPQTKAARLALAAEIGADGRQPLSAIDVATGQPELAQLPAVKVLRQVWASQCVTDGGRMRLGGAAKLPPFAEQVCSLYDIKVPAAGPLEGRRRVARHLGLVVEVAALSALHIRRSQPRFRRRSRWNAGVPITLQPHRRSRRRRRLRHLLSSGHAFGQVGRGEKAA